MLLVGIVFVISVGSFYLIHLLPGNPATVILGFGATPEAKAILYKQLGQTDLSAVLRLARQHPSRQPRYLVHFPDHRVLGDPLGAAD
jgi:ABC-type dipeptide/oligopeptide/nickel transport system permease component